MMSLSCIASHVSCKLYDNFVCGYVCTWLVEFIPAPEARCAQGRLTTAEGRRTDVDYTSAPWAGMGRGRHLVTYTACL